MKRDYSFLIEQAAFLRVLLWEEQLKSVTVVRGKSRAFPVTVSLLLLTSCLCLQWLVFRVIACLHFLRAFFFIVSIQVSVNQRSFIWALHQSSQQSKGKWFCFKIRWSSSLTHAWCFSTSVAAEPWLLAGMFWFSFAACKFSWVVRELLSTNPSWEFTIHFPCTIKGTSGISLCPCPFSISEVHRITLLWLNTAISSWGLYTTWFQTIYQKLLHSCFQSSHSRASSHAGYSQLNSVCHRVAWIRKSNKISFTNLRTSKFKKRVKS